MDPVAPTGRPRPARSSRPAPPSRLDGATVDEACRRLRRRDRALGALIRRAGPCAIRPAGHPYAGLVRAVLRQQLAGSAAAAIERRFHARFGGRLPSAAVLFATPDEELALAGLSRQKRAAVRDIARAFSTGELDARRLRSAPDDEVVAAVTALRGVGEWTAHMLLMFTFGRPDVLPVGDYGVRKGAMRLYGLPSLPGRPELEALAEPWRPFRSVASWYLWRAAEETAPEAR